MACHLSYRQVLRCGQVSSTSPNTKALPAPIHLFCQLSLAPHTHVHLGGTQQDRCNHARALLADLQHSLHGELRNSPKIKGSFKGQNPEAQPGAPRGRAAG